MAEDSASSSPAGSVPPSPGPETARDGHGPGLRYSSVVAARSYPAVSTSDPFNDGAAIAVVQPPTPTLPVGLTLDDLLPEAMGEVDDEEPAGVVSWWIETK